MRISDWSSDVCSSDLDRGGRQGKGRRAARGGGDPGGVPARSAALHGSHARGPAAAAAAQSQWEDRSPGADPGTRRGLRSEEHTSELQSLMRISYAVFCLKKKKQ